MPSALATLRQMEATTRCPGREQFRRAFPASVAACDRLWEVLDGSDAALLGISPDTYEAYCGRAWSAQAGVKRPALVATLDATQTRNGTRSYRLFGGAAGEVADLLARRDDLRDRLAAARDGDHAADPEALERATDALDHRARRRSREDLDTAFAGRWLGADAIETAYVHVASQGRPRIVQRQLGV
jgi:hypothetical protein